MPQPTTYTITLGTGTPTTLNCTPGDKIIWSNNTGYNISSFTLPTCVPSQPPVSVPLANNSNTGSYTVNNGSKGNYNYSYGVESPSRDTRGGTINVS
jgi:hypothetical protein